MGEEQAKLTHEEWQVVIAEHREAGGSVQAFCRERGLKDHSFYWHRRRMERDGAAVGFRELKSGVGSGVRLILGDGLRVEVERGFDAGCLQSVVRALL